MRAAILTLAALLAAGCSDLPTRWGHVGVSGKYALVSIGGLELPVEGTSSGELLLGFTDTFILELCDLEPACVVSEGTTSRTGNSLRLAGSDAVLEGIIQGTRITIEIDGASYVFEQFMPDEQGVSDGTLAAHASAWQAPTQSQWSGHPARRR